MSDELVTIYTAMDEIDAEVVKMGLEVQGIDCFLENANQALAGCIPVKVQVRASDQQSARDFIAEHEKVRDLQDGPDTN